VAGLGPAGLVAVQLALAHGAAEVIGIDPVAARGELAVTLGASRAVSPDATSWPAGRRDAATLDYALDCTGLVCSVEFLLDRTREAVALFGVLREEVHYAPRHMWGPGVSLLGYGDHNRAAAESALALILTGRLRLAPLVTHTLPLQRYAEGVELLRRQEAIKVLFDPWS
jgi:threonine dehydrogenase-like Zn-dependent dehydrogenase